MPENAPASRAWLKGVPLVGGALGIGAGVKNLAAAIAAFRKRDNEVGSMRLTQATGRLAAGIFNVATFNPLAPMPFGMLTAVSASTAIEEEALRLEKRIGQVQGARAGGPAPVSAGNDSAMWEILCGQLPAVGKSLGLLPVPSCSVDPDTESQAWAAIPLQAGWALEKGRGMLKSLRGAVRPHAVPRIRQPSACTVLQACHA